MLVLIFLGTKSVKRTNFTNREIIMATTITSSFQKLKENLEVTGLHKSTISTRQTNVRNVIEKGYTDKY